MLAIWLFGFLEHLGKILFTHPLNYTDDFVKNLLSIYAGYVGADYSCLSVYMSVSCLYHSVLIPVALQ